MRLILISSILLALTGPAFAGNEMGNGADNFAGDYGAAWFLGQDRTVSFCIEVSPQFGRDLDRIRSDIHAAWKRWLDYVDVKKLYDSSVANDFKYPQKWVETACSGKEDLHFKFGVEDEEVKREKIRYERPSAITYRKSFDAATAWGKGWIWFSLPNVVDPAWNFPTWSDKVFRSILDHEMGHVFGNVHVSGTIMARDLSQKLKEGRVKEEWTGKIDHVRELLTCQPIPGRATGFLGGAGYFNPYRAFEWLAGRKPQGKIQVEFRRTSSAMASELEIQDEQGTQVFVFEIKPSMNSPSYSSDVPVFKRMKGLTTLFRFSEGQTSFGVLKHPRLGDVTAIFESSMSSLDAIGPFGIKVLLDGFPQPLFVGFPEY